MGHPNPQVYPSHMISQAAAIPPGRDLDDGVPRETPPPTPVVFPKCTPQAEDKLQTPPGNGSLVALLQTIQRPADISLAHFEALGIHVISDVSPQDLLPDPSFLPPTEEWNAIPAEDLLELNPRTRKPLNNGNLSPGIQTYRERQKELLIPNTAAFRTIRRIPAPTGETAARLGNAYEFFKNLEFFSGYWPDTSLPTQPSEDPGSDTPSHLRTHVRTGTGSQLPPDYRQSLLSSFTKLIAYDFGCNVSFPRVEPRLNLTPPPKTNSPPSYFNSGAQFIFRTPTDRASARSGIIEGPVAVLSARNTTVFSLPVESTLDFAREIVAILLTAQQRYREVQKAETRFGEGKWWTTTPRWGGGPGGPIGKEGDRIPSLWPPKPIDPPTPTKENPSKPSPSPLKSSENSSSLPPPTTLSPPKPISNFDSTLNPPIKKEPITPSKPKSMPTIPSSSSVVSEAKLRIGGINGGPQNTSSAPQNLNLNLKTYPLPSPKRSRKTGSLKEGNLPVYEGYRKMNPPSSGWDRKTRYLSIGRDTRAGGGAYDDVFLLSSLNHHISILRARVPRSLLDVFNGQEGKEEWDRVVVWRSRWFDFFKGEERVQAMELVWGVVGWLMRDVKAEAEAESESAKVGSENGNGKVDGDAGKEGGKETGEKMDLS